MKLTLPVDEEILTDTQKEIVNQLNKAASLFEAQTLAAHKASGRAWTAPRQPYTEAINDPYFMLMGTLALNLVGTTNEELEKNKDAFGWDSCFWVDGVTGLTKTIYFIFGDKPDYIVTFRLSVEEGVYHLTDMLLNGDKLTPDYLIAVIQIFNLDLGSFIKELEDREN